MSEVTLDEPDLAPVDYVVIAFDQLKPTGEGLGIILDLVDRGIIRVLDFEVIKRNEDGTVIGLRAEDLSEQGFSELDVFIGAATGMFTQPDFDVVGAVLEPGAVAVAILYENTWAQPFVKHVRSLGGQVIATGRVTVDELAAAMEEVEG